MRSVTTLTLFALLTISSLVHAQDTLRPEPNRLLASVDTILSKSDSLAIFKFLDSLVSISYKDSPEPGSTIALRFGYNSNITATGRPFAFGNFGLHSGLTYLNKTGFYGDLTGYHSPEYTPSYFLTTATIGYLFSSKKEQSFSAEYSRFFYNLSDESYISYYGNVALMALFNFKSINLRTEYNLYHGTRIGHRFAPTLSFNLTKEKLWVFDKAQFWPGTQLLFGMEKISEYLPYSRDRRVIADRVRRGLPLFYEAFLNKYGLMNVALHAPLNLQVEDWNLMFMYSYNIPLALPGETLDLVAGGYFSLALTRYINRN